MGAQIKEKLGKRPFFKLIFGAQLWYIPSRIGRMKYLFFFFESPQKILLV